MDELPVEQSLTEEEARRIAGGLGRATLGCVAVVLSALILLLFISYAFAASRAPIITTFYWIERWATFIANVLVVFSCFPAYRASGQRPFLYLAFAGLSFAYGALFTLLFGSRPSAAAYERSHAQAVSTMGRVTLRMCLG